MGVILSVIAGRRLDDITKTGPPAIHLALARIASWSMLQPIIRTKMATGPRQAKRAAR
jgi:hypothetical protein